LALFSVQVFLQKDSLLAVCR